AASSASNNSYVPAVNGPLAFQMVNSTSGATIDFQLDGAATFAIAANATGADLAGQTLTIKVGNLTKTFEFVTAASGGPSGTNLAINVNSGDDAAALASAAAAAISGVTGFGSAVIVNGNQLTFNGASLRISTDSAVHDPATTLPAAGLIAPVANTWNLDIAPNITGADLAGEEITVNLGGTVKTFEFVTTASGGPSGANIAITVKSSDVATTLATLAAGAINTAFSTSSVAAANSTQLTLTGVSSASVATDGAVQDPNSTLQGEYPLTSPSAIRAGLITQFIPIAYNPTDSAVTVAAEVAAGINLQLGAGTVSASGNRVTLSGGIWQFAAAGTASTPQNSPIAFPSTGINAITVTDPDVLGTNANDAAIQFEEIVAVQSGSGVLSLGTNTTGITFLNGTQSGQPLLDFEGTLAAINQALNGLTFTPADEFVGPVHLSFLTNDNGNTGVGPAPADLVNGVGYNPAGLALQSLQSDVWLNVSTINDAPTLVNPSNPGLSLTAIDESPTNPPTNVTLPPNTGTLVYSANPLVPSLLTSAGANAMTINSAAATARFGIAVTGLSVPTMADQATAGGFWQYSLNAGQTWQTVGNLSFVIAPNATGADLAGQEFTVTFGNTSKTFE